ncbi:MAG: hypothetical protein JSV17_08410 [Candidatus Aminicenantes bacterium]|nr:MAG: hypothetical protein JSV17_08410 [Candidatus Aminicenantes bacterium]
MEPKGKPWTKKVRWIFYPIIIGAIIYLVLTQQQKSGSRVDADFNSWIEPEQRLLTAQVGDRVPFRLRIKNRGKKAWSSEGEYPCFLSYHLYLSENYRTVRFDNRRFPLPGVIEPGQTFEMPITLRAPIEAQRYIIMFDMVREGQSWFRDYGSRTAVIRFDVTDKEWPEDNTKIHSSQEELNTLLKIIRLTLHQNEVQFSGKTGKISGFAAGVDYPQIWLRDANTILPASRYFYDRSYLASWLEEHLAYQKANGSLEDWIDFRGESDKNTVETDQESSAVQAAFQIFNLLGSEWLEKSIDGARIIERLDSAMVYVCESRWNEEYGLIIGAHTADWGDVDLVDNDQEAIYVDDRTHWTADIYDQSMLYEACLNLAEMWNALSEKKRMAFWEEKARSIKNNTDKWLWQEDKGFYRVHMHLDSLRHDFDEEDMFAMGGNTIAIISGLADVEKSRRIIQEAIKRQETHDVSTISGTLLPPYPKDFFKHPLLDDPYEYQNGAQWDWFGARLIYAMFQHGFSQTAKEKWLDIINKNIDNRGFFEWDNKQGIGLGSDFYAGTAGSMGKALFEGYFGIRLKWNDLSIEPKLGKESGQVYFSQPSNGLFVEYDYKFDENTDRITLSINSNFPDKGTLRILSPWIFSDNKEDQTNQLEVFLDGKLVRHDKELKNQDELILISTDFRQHVVEISLKK